MDWQESLSKAKQTVSRAVGKNRSTIENGIDKAATAVSRRTSGKYDDTIRRGADKARSAVDKVGEAGAPPSSVTETEGTARPEQTPPAAPQRPV
jgi:hypothetical protein